MLMKLKLLLTLHNTYSKFKFFTGIKNNLQFIEKISSIPIMYLKCKALNYVKLANSFLHILKLIS